MAEDSLDLADPLDPNDVQAANAVLQKQAAQDESAAQAVLRSRREAYARLFSDRAIAGDAVIVLADLKRFCRGNKVPWDADQRVHALLTGRYEVYTRIDQHLRLSFDDLWTLLNEGGK